MILISHRGNLKGPDSLKENHPDYINLAIKLEYDVEIDVWHKENLFYLGHDEPQYEVKKEYLKNERLWCHAKNLDALNQLLKIGAHCFWHENDKATLTSKGYIWTHPGQQLYEKSICVLPEKTSTHILSCFGVCSDYIINYREETK